MIFALKNKQDTAQQGQMWYCKPQFLEPRFFTTDVGGPNRDRDQALQRERAISTGF